MSSAPVFPKYLPNLQAYRALLILYVVTIHILMTLTYEDERIQGLDWLFRNSDLAMTMLFVLSGFVITFMLLKERTASGTIHVGSFYKRRFLRLYPAYLLCICLCYGILLFPSLYFLAEKVDLPNDYLGRGQEFLVLLALGPHILFSLQENILGPFTWTVGTEANFYLVWGPLLKRMKSIKVLLPLILFSPAAELILYVVGQEQPSTAIRFLLHFNNYFRISSMAIGSLGCYIFLYRKGSASIFRNKLVQYAALGILLFLFVSGFRFGIVFYEFAAVLFTVIILGNIGPDEQAFLLENRILNGIARISYSLYLFHPVCIIATMAFLRQFPVIVSSLPLYIVCVFAGTLLSSFVVSTAVYYGIERRLYDRSSTLLSN